MRGRADLFVGTFRMKWSVIYRDKNGKRAETFFTASSRAELFKILNEKNVTAIQVREAPNVSGSTTGINILPRILVALVLIAVTTFAVLLATKNDTPSQHPKKESKKESVHVQGVKPRKIEHKSKEKSIVNSPAVRKNKKPSRYEIAARIQAEQDKYFASIDPGYEARKNRFVENMGKSPFKYHSERQISAIMSIKPGEFVLMHELHPSLQDDFIQSLKEEIVINKDDDPETIELKKTMIELRPQIKKMLDEGESLAVILDDYRRELMKINQMKSTLRDELNKARRTAKSVQEIEDWINAANSMLEEYGSEHIKLPITPGTLRLIERNTAEANQSNEEQQ